MASAPRHRGVTAERVSATVIGVVQGVGFRYWTQRHARRLGITGRVRNGADGRSVEVVAEGDSRAIDELLTLLRRGPPGSVVERMEARRETARGEFDAFAIAP